MYLQRCNLDNGKTEDDAAVLRKIKLHQIEIIVQRCSECLNDSNIEKNLNSFIFSLKDIKDVFTLLRKYHLYIRTKH